VVSSRPRRPGSPTLLRIGGAAVAGVAAGLSFEPYHLYALLPLAVAALTLLCVGRRERAGFGLGAVFGTTFMLVLLPWVTVIGAYAWVPLSVAEGLFYGLAGLATAAVCRLRWWPLWAACSWAAVEAGRALFPFGGFPWGRLAFATEDTPVANAFAYVGAPGVTFLVALLGVTLAWAVLALRTRPVAAVAGVLVAATLVCLPAVAAFPAVQPGDRRVTVAAVQGNVPGKGLEAFAERRVVLENHVDATLALGRRIDAGSARQPDLVVWPENSSDIDPYTDPSARLAIGSAAQAVHAPLLMGAVIGNRPDTGWHNRAIVWSPDGRPGRFYDKIHPVPFGEYIPLRSVLAPRIPALGQIPSDMIRGTRPGVLRVGPAKAGVLMCFEVAYDGLVHDLVRHGADLVVVPTNNATYTGTGQVEQQFAMSRLRAIETGRTVVVASTNGISGVVDARGRVVQRAPEQQRAVLEQTVPLSTRTTPAVAMGAWPERALSAVALVSVLVGLGLRRRRRTRTPDEPPSDPPSDPPGEPAPHPEPAGASPTT
jgi:apolipoprotein N-acyltransferase